MIKTVIFDFAGTLAYFDKSDLKGFFGALAGFGFKVKGEREAEYLLDFLPSLFSKANSWIGFAGMLAEEFGVALAAGKKEELARYLEKKLSFSLFGDAQKILDLPQKKAILTLASRFLVEHIDALKRFDIFTPKEIRYEKPDTRAFKEVLKRMKTVPQEAMMVGDNIENDIKPALALGMKAVLVDRQGKVRDNSIIKIASLKELKQYL